MKKTIAIIGANGFVGSELIKAGKNTNYCILPIVRSTPIQELDKADYIIHSGNPAKRFKAENYPENDFKETVEKTYKFYSYCKKQKFILISSMSCRTQLDTHYGRHRRACELIVQPEKSLIVRLGPMFGGNRTQDMLHDILNNREVFISEDTLYAYADVSWVANKIFSMIETDIGIKEIGAKNYVRLGDIKTKFKSTSVFLGKIENQIPENCTDGPNAFDVFDYAEKEKQKL